MQKRISIEVLRSETDYRQQGQQRTNRMLKPFHELIVVMPIFEDRESASLLVRDLAKCCTPAPYIIAVEDGSMHSPYLASDIAGSGLSGEVLYLARNMGHQRAIATGMMYVAQCYEVGALVVMDSDGEDRPDAIVDLQKRLAVGDVDVVVAERRKRSESLKFRLFYVLYRLLFQLLTGRTIRFGNFTVLSDRAVRRLASMQELWVHFAASLMTSRLRVAPIPTDRGKRYTGQSSMNYVALTLHGMRSLMVFAEDVLIRVGAFCALLALGAVGLMLTAICLKVAGIATPGWFSTVLGILFIIFLQAGILTFVTLMISGIVKSAPPIARTGLDQLIDRVERTVPMATSVAPLTAQAPAGP
jgi:hypothetical protein